ncbi:L,D-transpeptidase [Pseudonocardia acidicola]|uniref:L,D-transpeptidase n=1 Tax=Pseudonocardia acidicola TaxID=2724939 RepID=A0ABX1S9U5_9PSEU|nr:L,D-transpeptidase [Pseudonocardia acidicola]NMH97233.1 L,D-transpeptidase [Pseudonocardia acidicola]
MTAAAAVGVGTLLVGTVAMAAPAQAPATGGGQAAPAGNASAALVPGTPCTVTAKACADLAHRKAWLIQDGKVMRGPVPTMPGAPDEPTPVGTFKVQWKDPHHISDSPNHAEMPYSVFFADGGVAFHEGSLQRYSAGCIHLTMDDAKAFYAYLQVGDEVQVHAD